MDENYCQIWDIIARYYGAKSSHTKCFGTFQDNIVLVGCIAYSCENTTSYVVLGFETNASTTLVNCLAIKGEDDGFRFYTSDIVRVYNCNAIDNGAAGFYRSAGTVYCTNCISDGNGDDYLGTITKVTCLDSTDNVVFKDPGSNDYHLDSSDTAARGNGTDLSADANFPFDDDIDGDTRSAWDIGFDELAEDWIPQIIMVM